MSDTIIDTSTSNGGAKKSSRNPMRQSEPKRAELMARRLANLSASPRCLARTRSGKPCQGPAIRGGNRCRMHGGRGGAPEGERNGAWKHGRNTAELVEARKALARINRAWRTLSRRLEQC